jgi:hypothetical protein
MPGLTGTTAAPQVPVITPLPNGANGTVLMISGRFQSFWAYHFAKAGLPGMLLDFVRGEESMVILAESALDMDGWRLHDAYPG